MPFEHETKFILSRSATPDTIAALPGVQLEQSLSIKQLYMDDGVRLRETRPLKPGLPLPAAKMTYKRRTNLGPVEIETEISDADFMALAPQAERFLYKDRFVFSEATTGLDLELDILKLAGWPVIMVMLEVEHDAGEVMRLDRIEKLLSDADILTLRVSDHDNRFSNYRLADPYYRIGLAATVYHDYPAPAASFTEAEAALQREEHAARL
jgi:hypothetical protein